MAAERKPFPNEKQMTDSRILTPLWHGLLILILGALIYSNTFQAPFVLDDYTSIVRNPAIQDLASYAPGGEGFESHPRRWFGYFTFALNYHFGGFSVTGYHLLNLIIHLAAALLVYLLVLLTFRTPVLEQSRLGSQAPAAALLSALFFVAHPVQTQAVTYIVQRLTSLSTLLYLLAFVCYILARLHGEKRNSAQRKAKPAGGEWRKAAPLLAGAVLAAFLAMKTKEIAFTLPLAVLLYEIFFFQGAWKRRILYLLPLLLTLPLIPLSVILTGASETAPETAATDDPFRAGTDMSRLVYFFTQLRVLVTYLRLIVLPVNQNLDYDYPVYTSFLEPPVFLSSLLLLALTVLAAALSGSARTSFLLPAPLRSSFDPAYRLVSFGILWFFLTLSVESSFIPIEDVIFEHRLYLPLAGISAIFALMLLLLSRRVSALAGSRAPIVLGAVLIAALSTATWQRNQVWGSNIRLWEDTALKSPGKARPWYNLGTYYSDQGMLQESGNALARALNIDPASADAWHNLGRTYMLAGMNEEAIDALQRALNLRSGMSNAAVNLGVALIRAGRPDEAVLILERETSRLQENPEVRLNLGIAYARSGDLASARRELSVLQIQAPHLAPNLLNQINRAAEID